MVYVCFSIDLRRLILIRLKIFISEVEFSPQYIPNHFEYFFGATEPPPDGVWEDLRISINIWWSIYVPVKKMWLPATIFIATRYKRMHVAKGKSTLRLSAGNFILVLAEYFLLLHIHVAAIAVKVTKHVPKISSFWCYVTEQKH